MRHGENLKIPPHQAPPPEWLPTSWSVISSAAFPAPNSGQIREAGFSPLPGAAPAIHFDRTAIAATSLFTLGVDTDLIGQQMGVGLAGVTAVPGIGPVPSGYRCFIDQIAPYISDAAGNTIDVTPEILGAGLSVTWRVRKNVDLVSPYGAITSIIAPWWYVSPRPLLEVDQGDRISASVQIDAGIALTLLVGMRIKGRMIPWDYRNRKSLQGGSF